jgi:hypothetical protein
LWQGCADDTQQEAEFRATDKAVYKVTKEGTIVARWVESGKPGNNSSASASKPNLHNQDSSSSVTKSAGRSSHSADDTGLARRPSMSERVRPDFAENNGDKEVHAKDSHAARLKQILDEPALRSLFREFLRANFCEENLSFWLDVQDFKRRFNTTSSAVAVSTPTGGKQGRGTGHAAMEKHQQDLIAMAFVIYNSESYLAIIVGRRKPALHES